MILRRNFGTVHTVWYFMFSILLGNEGDGHPFHQYQQSEQSPLILIELTEHKKTTTNNVKNPSPVLGQTQYFTRPLGYLLTVEV